MSNKIMSLTKVAAYIGVPKRSLYRMLNDGRFPVQPIPKTSPRMWATADVDAWIAGEHDK